MNDNGFEQFIINYCNEKLQQLFIELTLKTEQEEYKREGIDWTDISYFNNKTICELIEAKPTGIISLLDEQCVMPGNPSDASFLDKLNSLLSNHAHFDSRTKSVKDKTIDHSNFRLKHYAGNVDYNVDGFMEKNKDTLYWDVMDVAGAHLAESNASTTSNDSSNAQLKRPDTLATQCKTSMGKLVTNLMQKTPHYIRCIKPNNSKEPGLFDQELVLHQCRYLG